MVYILSPVFWKGGKSDERNTDKRSPNLTELPANFSKVFKASLWGMTAPWTLIISAFIGVFIMAAPGIFGAGINESIADVHHLCGALIVVISVISMGEVVRTGRYLNVITGLALSVLPWLADGHYPLLKIIGSVAGVLVIILSIPRGVIKEKYGSWDKMIK